MNKGDNNLSFREGVKKLINLTGYTITQYSKDPVVDDDVVFQEIYKSCQKYTMTSKERMYALYKSVQYVIHAEIPGDFVECGVWRGGSAMLIAHTLKKLDSSNRTVYLYDTFEGMSEPTKADQSLYNEVDTRNTWEESEKKSHNEWCYASLEDVRENMISTDYPLNKIIFIQGKVEETLPKTSPQQISLLRLDTDWYESTKHELVHLFPLLSAGGVLILDDYGYWAGSKKAVDEYFSDGSLLLNRIDISGRVGIKIK